MNVASLNLQSWRGYLELMRPANIVTAWADILVGFAASGSGMILAQLINGEASFVILIPLAWLLLATTGLYGGGIVFNDVFDAELDAKERPNRAIPSGRVSRQNAALLGSILFAIGIIAAFQVSALSAAIATFITLSSLLYDSLAKHHPFFGPLNMGLCRGSNLLLGVSAVPAIIGERWYLALIPVLYIAAITAISQGEVHGGKKITGVVALLLIAIVLTAVLALGLLGDYTAIAALPFAIFLAIRILPNFIKAALEPIAENIRNAVKIGVLSLIVLDATVASGFAGLYYGLLVLILLPISMKLAKVFAVT
ncbi:MAG: UbiA-like protein EboC [Nostoc sp. DedVER02]|uniref:UbiA-like protein EboC n=1 Tax=unclassified Nostoc TaxID=2593658 RepID=UPI002AD2E809|nr:MULTISPECIES: UbiA-like protein EboC [unclassified Nostoc]MDZ7984613.1 UbiA-like protein EboC [Nostoc sp. DedVER02]MDZ8111206.1 UbiA-like protein EboC [Nostoc sp. DedVER01b]